MIVRLPSGDLTVSMPIVWNVGIESPDRDYAIETAYVVGRNVWVKSPGTGV